MDGNKPLVSIIVRTKDRPKLLRTALASISAQTYRPVEVVIINDGGFELEPEELKTVLGDASLRYVRLEENRGRANAGNLGIEKARGDYVGFLDDDDELHPDHVETLISFLEQSDYKVAYTDSVMVYKGYDPQTRQMREEKRELVFSQDFDFDKLLFENYIPFMCLMFKRDVLADAGGLRPDFDLYEDWDFLIRIAGKYPFRHIKKVTADYNQWDLDLQISQRNRNTDLLRQSYLKVIREHFDKITPSRVYAYIGDYYHTRNYLKGLKDQFEARAARAEAKVGEMGTREAVLEATIAERGSRIKELEALVKEQEGRLHVLDAALREKDRHAAEIEDALRAKEAHLQLIQSGHGWRLLSKYFALRDKLLPQGTKRRLFSKLLVRVIMHPREVFRNVNKTSMKKFFYYLDNTDPLTVEKKIERKLSHDVPPRRSFSRAPEERQFTPQAADRNYFDFLFGMNSGTSKDYVPQSSPALPETEIRLIAFYLPQFHPIPENDEWWGKGFTEWTNVTRAVPQFVGHYQPRLPGELGFYDLRIADVQRRQVELARQYGLHGFCFHFYWFAGRTLLEGPIRHFADNFDFPFCINWANENWTRRWDGEENEILISQRHSREDDLGFIKHISVYLKKENYIRINSKPLLLVYRPALFPNPKATAARWRDWCRTNGIGEIYLALTHAFEHVDPGSIGFDAAIDFPPNTFPMKDVSDRLDIVNPSYKGLVFDYNEAVAMSIGRGVPPYKKFRGAFPSWDNEARKPGRGTVLINSSPEAYREWLTTLCEYTRRNFEPEERLLFINAWNEWAESAYLEPDRRYGYAYLQATAEGLIAFSEGPASLPGRWKILFVSHDACKGGSQEVLLNVISWFKLHTFADLRICCLEGGELMPRFKELGATLVLSDMRDKGVAKEDLTRELMEFCGGTPDLIYCNSVASGREYGLLRSVDAPILMHFHELEMSIRRYASDYVDDVVKYSERFVAISGAVRDNLMRNHGVDPAKISTIYSSIAPDSSIDSATDSEKRRIRERLGLKRDPFLVFGCGLGMAFRKGADLFIEAARVMRNRGEDGFHFYWIGEFYPAERDERYGVWADHVSAMKKEGLDRYVTFLGLKENPRTYMQAGDVFFLSSREEPVGLVGLEAAECGLPVICFADAGGMPDFVGEDAGFIVPFEDAGGVVDKVSVLMRDDDVRHRLGARAREKVLDCFTVEHSTPLILSACRTTARKQPAVSVIIPNYNHARYLQKRLQSVFAQTFKDVEVILLDDASTDDSMEMLNRYAHHADVRIVRNESNSGSPFKQWLRGLDMARADIIWIAESDDISDPRFLEMMLPAFQNAGVKLAYSNSHVINENDEVTGDYENGEYLVSLSPTKWKKGYITSATSEINEGLGVKDTILNISSVLFRKPVWNETFRRTLQDMRIAGDWYFIVNLIKGGKVCYDARKLNYHRRHEESVIGKTVSEKKMEDFFREFCLVQRYIFENYRLDETFCQKWEHYLQKQWNDFYPGRPFEELQKYYPFGEMREKILSAGAL